MPGPNRAKGTDAHADGASVQLEVAFLDPAQAALDLAEEDAQHRGQHKAQQDHAGPVPGGDGGFDAGGDVVQPAGVHPDGPHHAAGAHPRGDCGAVHFKVEQAGGHGAGDGAGQGGGDPDPGVADDVAHLQHAGAEALADQAAHTVLLIAHHRKAHHLGAAAGHRRAARQAGQAQGGADGRRGDGQGQGHPHDHRHQHPHDEGGLLGGPHDERAHPAGRRADGGGDEQGQPHPGEDGHQRGDQQVHLGLLADGLAQLGGNDGDEQHGQGPAGPAQGVGGPAHRHQAEQDKVGGVEGIADGAGHGRTAHGRGVVPDGHQHGDAQLLAQGVEDGADQQAGEQALRHGAQGVDQVPLGGDDDVLAC